MAQPPAGSSLLFGALADSGKIKQRKNGSYRMVLKGVDKFDWFTDRPDRVAGEWSSKKLLRKWDSLFGDVEPNAQATFEVGSKRELATFEMYKPKLGDSNQTLSFKVRGIGEKNKDLLIGLNDMPLSNASIFVDGTNAYGKTIASGEEYKCIDGSEPLLLENPDEASVSPQGLPRDQLFTYCPSYELTGQYP